MRLADIYDSSFSFKWFYQIGKIWRYVGNSANYIVLFNTYDFRIGNKPLNVLFYLFYFLEIEFFESNGHIINRSLHNIYTPTHTIFLLEINR